VTNITPQLCGGTSLKLLGLAVQVDPGQEDVTDEEGKVYTITWTLDDQGLLRAEVSRTGGVQSQ
jgi:hypothetical protein